MSLTPRDGKGDEDNEIKEGGKEYFKGHMNVIKEICQEIIDRKLSDFGTLLAGNDICYLLGQKFEKYKGYIERKTLFQVIKKLFDHLGDGDISNLIDKFPTLYSNNKDKIKRDY